jgi:hypothetical protein
VTQYFVLVAGVFEGVRVVFEKVNAQKDRAQKHVGVDEGLVDHGREHVEFVRVGEFFVEDVEAVRVEFD